MRLPLYDHAAKRRTAGVSFNAYLVARSAAHGIDISRSAEAAPALAFEAAEKAAILEEMKECARFTSEYVAGHGYPFPDSMAMFMPDDDDPGARTDDAA